MCSDRILPHACCCHRGILLALGQICQMLKLTRPMQQRLSNLELVGAAALQMLLGPWCMAAASAEVSPCPHKAQVGAWLHIVSCWYLINAVTSANSVSSLHTVYLMYKRVCSIHRGLYSWSTRSIGCSLSNKCFCQIRCCQPGTDIDS